jgi:hypothetical protein
MFYLLGVDSLLAFRSTSLYSTNDREGDMVVVVVVVALPMKQVYLLFIL